MKVYEGSGTNEFMKDVQRYFTKVWGSVGYEPVSLNIAPLSDLVGIAASRHQLAI